MKEGKASEQGAQADPRGHAGTVAESMILKRQPALQSISSAIYVIRRGTSQSNANLQKLTT